MRNSNFKQKIFLKNFMTLFSYSSPVFHSSFSFASYPLYHSYCAVTFSPFASFSIFRKSLLNANLPYRALVKKKSAKQKEKQSGGVGGTAVGEEVEVRYVPFIPPSLVGETIKIFKEKTKLKALLDIIYSSKDSLDDEKKRFEYQSAFEKYEFIKNQRMSVYLAHEEKALMRARRAIENLPSDLYEEAIQSEKEKMNEKLFFHYMYRDQLFKKEKDEEIEQKTKNEECLSEIEMKKLQIFQNLMYVRFPFEEMKKNNPQLFWVPEKSAQSRQKANAKQKKKDKTKKKK